MDNECAVFLIDLFDKINEVYNNTKYGSRKITIEHHPNKDYYTIDCEFEYCNSKYSDCVVFYSGKDDFDPTEILNNLDAIITKANKMIE